MEEKTEKTEKENSELSLKNSTQNLIDRIVESDNMDEIKDLTTLFNINQMKKNIIRINKLNELMDKVDNQAIERFEKNPNEVSNKDLLDYMQIVQNSIDKSQKSVGMINEEPKIQVLNQSNDININLNNEVNSLSEESRTKILDVVKTILNSYNENNDEVIELETNKEGEQNDKE